MITPCLVYGAGGHGRVVCDVLDEGADYDPVMFLDSDASLDGKALMDRPVHCDWQAATRAGVAHAVVAVGDNRARLDIAARLRASGFSLVNAIHPRAWISRNVRAVGTNIVVCAGASVCTGCRISDSVILNTACIVDHECVIDEGVHICPGAQLAGRVQVEHCAFVGLGSSVIQNTRIGTGAVIGAGAVVIHDVPDDATVVGVPARPIRTRKT